MVVLRVNLANQTMSRIIFIIYFIENIKLKCLQVDDFAAKTINLAAVKVVIYALENCTRYAVSV